MVALVACSGSAASNDATGEVTTESDHGHHQWDHGGTRSGGTTTGGGPMVDPGNMSVNLGGADATCKPDAMAHMGEGTYYTFADGGGNCGFPPTPNDLLVGAMNHTDFAASAVCGSCVNLTGPKGTIKIRIVESVPRMQTGRHRSLADGVRSHGRARAWAREEINWHYISCQSMGPVIYHFKDGSNAFWTAVQMRNHRYAGQVVRLQSEGRLVKDVPRLDYNYFVDAGGMGPGPYTFRVTDVYNHVIEDTGIALKDNADSPGAESVSGVHWAVNQDSLAAHPRQVEPRWPLEAAALDDVGDLRAEADAELGHHPCRVLGRFVGEQAQDRVAVACPVHGHRFAILHEDDEDRDIGIQAVDEFERALHLLGSLVERAEHESVAVVNAVLLEERA